MKQTLKLTFLGRIQEYGECKFKLSKIKIHYCNMFSLNTKSVQSSYVIIKVYKYLKCF